MFVLVTNVKALTACQWIDKANTLALSNIFCKIAGTHANDRDLINIIMIMEFHSEAQI